MGSIAIKKEAKDVGTRGVHSEKQLYTRRNLKRFNAKVLGIGDVSQRSVQREAIAAMFDLEGFTNFCRQVDPHLSIPKFLSEFLDWLFEAVKKELIQKRYRAGCLLYTDLPFFAKFTGDGILFLWDSSELSVAEICNVAVSLENICRRYRRDFAPRIRQELSDTPPRLRCGVARGLVCSVGNGEDFVGPCINMSARLQKLSSLPFCFSKRGFDYEKGMVKETAETYEVKRVSVRGMGTGELVCVPKLEFGRLKKAERALFKEV